MPKRISTLKKLAPKAKRFPNSVSWYHAPVRGFIPVAGGVAYSALARRLIRFNPKLIQATFEAFNKLRETESSVANVCGVSLHVLPHAKGGVGNAFYKLKIGKREFFMKVIIMHSTKQQFNAMHDLALDQHHNLIEAKKVILKNSLNKDFDVAEPHYAFVSKHHSFQVTSFHNCESVESILKGADSPVKTALLQKMDIFHKGVATLRKEGFFDLQERNAFFSPETGKFILFDLRRT